MNGPLMTIDEGAAYLGVPRETLKYWIYRTRIIPSVGLGAGRRKLRRLRKADLDAFIERGLTPAFQGRLRRVQ